MEIKNWWLIHVIPNSVEGCCAVKISVRELFSPEVSSIFIEKVYPYRNAWPATTIKSFLVLIFHEDVGNVCFVFWFQLVKSHPWFEDFVLLDNYILTVIFLLFFNICFLFLHFFFFIIIVFPFCFALLFFRCKLHFILFDDLLWSDLDMGINNHYNPSLALLNYIVHVLVRSRRECVRIKCEVLALVSMRDIHPQHINRNHRLLEIVVPWEHNTDIEIWPLAVMKP